MQHSKYYYYMNYSFEYIDIILLAMIAGFIFLRLRGILGKKTGFEEDLSSSYSHEVSGTKPTPKINEDIFDDNAKWNENERIYVDILAGISCVLCSLWKDDMEWFSIIMIFTNPLGLSLGLLHLMCPYWYKYYENNHFRMVKYNAYYLCPIAIFLVLCVREGLLSVSTST